MYLKQNASDSVSNFSVWTNMKTRRIETEQSEGVLKYNFVKEDGTQLMYSDAIEILAAGNEHFSNLINVAIVMYPSTAVFWECSSFVPSTAMHTPFEFVLIPSEELENTVTNIIPFRKNFIAHRNSLLADSQHSSSEVVVFTSLGGDAILVVPCPADLDNTERSPPEMAHLSLFIRTSSPEHRLKLWRTVGITLKAQLLNRENANKRFWLSTSGLGVSWLHVRIDTTPKYYHWAEYKDVRS